MKLSVAALWLTAVAAAALLLAAVPAAGQYNYYCGVAPGEVPMIPPLAWDAASGPAPTLIQVQAMARHGDRTQANAYECWPGDSAVYSCRANAAQATVVGNSQSDFKTSRLYRFLPIDGEQYLFGNCYVGQLTEQGYEQELANGAAFHEAYVGEGKLLSEDPTSSQVQFQCDSSPRVMTSTMAIIEGMFPYADARAAPAVPLVDILTQDVQVDATCPTAYLCPALVNVSASFLTSPQFQQFNASVVWPLTEQFASLLNMSAATLNLGYLFDCHWTHACHNYALPPQVPAEMWAELVEVVTNFTAMQMAYPSRAAYGALSMGPFIETLVARAAAAVNGSAGAKRFYGHGTHDSCVMPFVAALGVLGDMWTPYAGVVVMELYAVGSGSSGAESHAVRFVRYGEELTLPGCPSALCPWEVFVAITAELIPTPEECAFKQQ